MTRRFLGCVALLAGLTTLLAAPVPKNTATPIYFPTTVGAKWVYTRDDGGEESMEISEVVKDGEDFIISRKAGNGTATIYAKTIVSAEGLKQEKLDTNGKTAVVWILKGKFRSGDSWDVADGGKRSIFDAEPVEVPAGKYAAVRVEWEQPGVKTTSWYAPDVGEVKRVVKRGDAKEVVSRSLKSFKAK